MKPLTLIVVADGLRPSAIKPSTMPFVHQLMAEGTHYPQAFAAFPALTRTNAATMATGCRPGRTGILGNQVWHPDLGHVDTGEAQGVRQLRARGAMPQVTLAETLARGGREVLVVGNGSAGCTYVLNPGADHGYGATIALPAGAASALPKLGPPRSDDCLELAVAEAVSSIASMSPEVVIFWSGQPDTVQHASGPDSPLTLRTLTRVDAAVRSLHAAATENRGACNLIVTADHGICETSDSLELSGPFDAIAARVGLLTDDVVLAYNGGTVFAHFREHVGSRDRRAYAEQIAEQSWAGPVFSADEHCPDAAFPMSLALDRVSAFTPDLIITMRTNASESEILDDAGWAGAVHARSEGGVSERGVHGTLHPADLRIPLILHGPAFKRRTQQVFPAGTVDIAPTVHALVTGTELTDVDGRLLSESLVDHGQSTGSPPAVRIQRRGTHQIGFVEYRDHRYLVGGASTPPGYFGTTTAGATKEA